MPQCKAGHDRPDDGKDWTYYCVQEAGHAGPHVDGDGQRWENPVEPGEVTTKPVARYAPMQCTGYWQNYWHVSEDGREVQLCGIPTALTLDDATDICAQLNAGIKRPSWRPRRPVSSPEPSGETHTPTPITRLDMMANTNEAARVNITAAGLLNAKTLAAVESWGRARAALFRAEGDPHSAGMLDIMVVALGRVNHERALRENDTAPVPNRLKCTEDCEVDPETGNCIHSGPIPDSVLAQFPDRESSDAGMPENVTPEKLQEIVERVRTYHGNGSDDPYEALAVRPWAQIALHDADVLLLCDVVESLTREHDQAVQERDDYRRAWQRWQAAFKKVHWAGAMLANCAYNLAQRDHLTADERRSLDESRVAWDAAVGESRSPASPTPE